MGKQLSNFLLELLAQFCYNYCITEIIMNKELIEKLMREAGYAAPHVATRPQKFAELFYKDIMCVVAAHALSNDSALDVLTNLTKLYED